MSALQHVGSQLAVGASIKPIPPYYRQSEDSRVTKPAYLNKEAIVYCTHIILSRGYDDSSFLSCS